MSTTAPLTKRSLVSSSTAFHSFRNGLVVALAFVSACAGGLAFAGAANAAPIPNTFASANDFPTKVLIGESFTFKVRLKNNGTNTGYAPFIDLAFDYRGADAFTTGDQCDGVFFQNAELVDINGAPPTLVRTTVPNVSFPSHPDCTLPPFGTSLNHPYGLPASIVPLGWQITTVELPFGSYEPGQPAAVLKVTAKVDEFADLGTPLRICFRGGFRYGSTATGVGSTPPAPQSEVGANVTSDWNCKTVKPAVVTLKKKYSGPEDETVSGPNFVRGYTVVANIANGQTINNFTIKDFVPSSLTLSPTNPLTNVKVWKGSASVPIFMGTGSVCPPGNLNNAMLTVAGGTLTVLLCDPVTGTTILNDVTLKFSFYVKQGVVPQNCIPKTIINLAQVIGDWVPLDPRDVPILGSVLASAKKAITAKCLAIQKSVNRISTVPGDTLTYTLRFQVSDYFTIGKMVVRDVLADGQTFVPDSADLVMQDRYGTSLRAYTPDPFFSDLLGSPGPATNWCLAGDPLRLVKGGRILTFAISTPSIPRHMPPDGLLTGGRAFLPDAGAATGTITFKAKVGPNSYTYPKPGNQNIDEHDPINNCVAITGRKFVNSSASPTATTVQAKDGSKTGITVRFGKFTKRILKITRNGVSQSLTPPLAPNLTVGDLITFELRYPFPTTDTEHFSIKDWPPQPALKTAGFSPGVPPCPPWPSVPPVKSACWIGTGGAASLPNPTVSLIGGSTGLRFNFIPAFINNSNISGLIRLRFTLRKSNDPYADGLHLTNVAQQCEKNSYLTQFCQVAIAAFTAQEPALRIHKGVLATTNTHDGLLPPPPFPITPGNVATYAGQNVGGGVDAGDTITYVIAVVNYGSAPGGAFGTTIQDPALPPGLTLLPGSTTVTNGCNITPLLTTGSLSSGLTLTAPLPGSSASPLCKSVALITFKATMDANIQPGCYSNTATITAYYSTAHVHIPSPSVRTAVPQKLNFAPTLGGQLSDTAQVCVRPVLNKSLKSTDNLNTLGNIVTSLETVRYRLEIQVPEGVSPGFTITELLPAGLSYWGSATVATVSTTNNGVTASLYPTAWTPGDETTLGSINPTVQIIATGIVMPIPVNPYPCVDPTPSPVFMLGNVTNTDSDNNLEYIILEFDAKMCDGLKAGITLSNTFSLGLSNGQTYGPSPSVVLIGVP